MRANEVKTAPYFAPTNEVTAHAAAERANPTQFRPWFRKKRFVLPLALILVLVISLAASGGFGRTSDPAGTAQPTVSSSVAAGIGTMLRDGKFEFVVTGVERPGKVMAGKYGKTLTAQGEFVVVRVNVTNMGTDTRPPNSSSQFLFDDQGKKFNPSSAILSTKEALKFVQRITLGDTVDGVLMLFDVPRGTKVAKIELHDTPLSHGVSFKIA